MEREDEAGISQTYTVRLVVTGIPDSAGLRIRATDPIGLYISSRNPELAKEHFERLILILLMKRQLLTPERGGSVILAKRPDWKALLVDGSGEVVVRTMSAVEVVAAIRDGEPLILAAAEQLRADWWNDPQGNPFCFVSDHGGNIDEWVTAAIKKDFVL